MNTQKLNSAIAEFTKKKKSNTAYYEENWAERKERKEYYQSFTKDKLLAMTEEAFLEYISKLWSMLTCTQATGTGNPQRKSLRMTGQTEKPTAVRP